MAGSNDHTLHCDSSEQSRLAEKEAHRGREVRVRHAGMVGRTSCCARPVGSFPRNVAKCREDRKATSFKSCLAFFSIWALRFSVFLFILYSSLRARHNCFSTAVLRDFFALSHCCTCLMEPTREARQQRSRSCRHQRHCRRYHSMGTQPNATDQEADSIPLTLSDP